MAVEDMISDIRREAVEHTNEIVKEGLKGDYATQGKINDSSRLSDDRFFDVGRDTADLRAQVVSVTQQVAAGFATAAKDAEINALKTQVELAKQSTYLSDKIDSGNEKTRDLINDLKYNDLNRLLIERDGERRHWHGHYDQSQFQALQSQLQAFQSQLQETRQGMVNFGTMAGVGQTSTSNNVR